MTQTRIHSLEDLLADAQPEGECLVWQRARTHNGYGLVHYRGKQLRAHRLSWELAHGHPIPDGLLIRHTCDNRPCINPDHLLAGTQKDNIGDMWERGRQSPHHGRHERSALTRQRSSESALKRWANMSDSDRAAFSAATSNSRRGKPRGPYKGRTAYAAGYRPVAS